MYASALILTAVLGSQALASHPLLPVLGKRQVGEAFDPVEDQVCPSDWPICGNSNYCYNTAEDYTCCPGQEHVCPPDTFCMQSPYCCPDGMDIETCAEQYGITLEPTPTPEPQPTTTSRPVIPTTSSSSVTKPTSSSAVPPSETPETPVFTGAANAQLAVHAAALLGWAGVFGNLFI